MTKPDPRPAAKPAKAPTKRMPATWTVFEVVLGADVYAHGDEPGRNQPLASICDVLIQQDTDIVARTGADACWKVAEGDLIDRARSNDPPVLCASRNGTAHGLTEARPYALKATVERVK